MIKPDGLTGKAVDVRRFNLCVAITPQHVERLLIAENKDQVGFPGRLYTYRSIGM